MGGRYRASDFEDRAAPEWPPHPARLFYAAVAAVHGAGGDPAEIELLEWWESLAPPTIQCSDLADSAGVRPARAVDHYVRGNYARSWTTDLHGQWDKLLERAAKLDQLSREQVPEKRIRSAQRDLDKAWDKLRADTARATAAGTGTTAAVLDSVLEVLPDNRDRQARQFPSVTPDDPVIRYGWDAPVDPQRVVELDGILGRIARLGHSASLVTCRVVPEAVQPVWIPGSDGSEGRTFRTVTRGVHEALVEEYARHGGVLDRNMPAVMTDYRRAGRPAPVTATATGVGAGEWIVLPLPSRVGIPPTRVVDVARAVRSALMSYADEPVGSFLSGHRDRAVPDERTGPATEPHLSVLSLPDVSHVHSSGQIRAVALALPLDAADADVAQTLAALRAWGDTGYRLLLPGGSAYTLEPAVRDRAGADPTVGRVASRSFWARTAQAWSSVTPVALDRHPKVNRRADFDTQNAALFPLVSTLCLRAGLPAPIEISASSVPVWPSVPPVAGGPGVGRPGRPVSPQYRVGHDPRRRRYTVHLSIRFAEPVTGPLVLGAGRYFGYGLMLPTPGVAADR
ncbi:type I-G CRISPR-associated protein Csb2 [Skermania piniformis]|uniref:Type I-U CRISPR-associated protein Cas5/Cas6 n=1 Tax=Skermania pinensis TaxID=39122 RepID=A0ABX8S7N5_9ACTN|nr:type I-U CRISPR-associated protein Csb2 [Skermania piniformis]QXQ13863.1 type I-U CRISPR-associated protein Cas5/Cas6 [Skermania piniformis]